MLRKLSLRLSLSICLGPFLWITFLCWTSACAPSTPESPTRSARRLSQEVNERAESYARRQSAIYNLRASSFSGQLLPRPWTGQASGLTVKSDGQEEPPLPKEELSLDRSDRSVDKTFTAWSGWLMAVLGLVGLVFPMTYCIVPYCRKLLCSGCTEQSYYAVPDSEMIGSSIHSRASLELTGPPQPQPATSIPQIAASTSTEYFFIGEEAVAPVNHVATESEPEAELYPEADGPEVDTKSDATVPATPENSSQRRSRSPHPHRPELGGVSFQAVAAPVLPIPSVATPDAEPKFASQAATSMREANKSNLLMLYASPLCRIDATRGATPLPSLAFEQEWRNLVTASVESPNGPLTLAARPMTAASLQRTLSHGITRGNSNTTVLHLSAHGTPQGLVLEDGKGTAHLLSCELMKEMLSLRAGAAPFQLVVVNACQSLSVGQVFADSGIPHVVCSEDKIMDAWVQLFMRTFYTALFCGSTVAVAFDAAVTALRCQPGIPQEASQSFCLLPREGDHDKAICVARMAARSKPLTRVLSTPFEQLLPELPEDFTGRTLDVWSVLQHLDKRRFVTVCNHRPVPGVGKSTLLDAVHRASALHMQMRCVKVRLGLEVEDCTSLLMSIRSAVQLALAEEDWLGARKGSCQSRLTSGALTRPRKCLPRRPAKKMQEPETPAWSNEELLQSIFHELSLLGSKWQRRITTAGQTSGAVRGSKVQAVSAGDASSLGILLLIHGCSSLLERQPDETLSIVFSILQQCPVRIVLSSKYRVLGPGCGQFKVVHYELGGLKPADAARLFLRRTQRPLKWKEVLAGTDASIPERAQSSAAHADAPVVLQKDSEKEVLELIASHPALARLKGAPQALVQLACQMGHKTLTDFLAEGYNIPA
mmetsp:Transcript_45432/g.106164  ORF Transcript_45432/g.106164 Transcript_45432/m.106164 type:complete len:881 (-) Transcript_45432:222-2864(-)